MTSIGICGLGTVGGAIRDFLIRKGQNVYEYDKPKKIGLIDDLVRSDLVLLCLPTPFSKEEMGYDTSYLRDVCKDLGRLGYGGLVVVKSTTTPGTCRMLQTDYKIRIVHSPEFISAATAHEDIECQKQIVIGGEERDAVELEAYFKQFWPQSIYSRCTLEESECMKIGVNAFYATKVQFFNELWYMTEACKGRYDKVVEMMLKNGWIAPHHVAVPGRDMKMSFGGACLPKDVQAMAAFLQSRKLPGMVVKAVVEENKLMRPNG